jgi:hypothetical protein
METQTPVNGPAPSAFPRYVSLPPERDPEPASWLSAKFIIFAILVIGAAAVAGSLKSGKLTLPGYFHANKATAQARPSAAPAASAAPVAPLKPGAFVVTSISLGQPSFAIINGQSRIEGDPVEAPGVTGWKVKRIVDGAVWLQNGTTLAPLPLSMPGIKPLDDELHPLN